MARLSGILFVFFLFFASFKANSTHIVGGEMNYEYLGNNLYRITLTVYRDCFNGQAPFDDPASVAIYKPDGTLISTVSIPLTAPRLVPNVINSPCFPPPTNICYEVAVYEATTSMPPTAGGYVLAYQRCCRNGSIVNLRNVNSTGATYIATVPGPELVLVNDNPVFRNWPPTFICRDAPFTFDHSAVDINGDSLVYELCEPLSGGSVSDPRPVPASPPPYDPVIYATPYSVTNPLGGVPMLIDPETGILTATPNALGQFVYGVCVKEYRNGVYLGETRRDFQVNVVSCPQITVASIFSPTIACGSLAANFVNTSYNAVTYMWNFGDSTTLGDTSVQRNPVYTYPDTGTYTVTLVAYSGINPNCNDTATGTVLVYPEFISQFSTQNERCTPNFNFTDNSYGSGGQPNFWLWTFGDGAISGLQNPQHIYSSPGTYTVTLISSTDSACYDTLRKQITVLKQPFASFEPVIDTCAFKVRFRNTSMNANTNSWNFGDNIQGIEYNPVHQYILPGNYTITLEVNTDSFCVDSTSRSIFIPPLPVPSFTSSSLPCDSNVSFQNQSSGAVAWRWDFGDGTSSSDFEPSHLYQMSGSIPVALTAISPHGCEQSVFDTLYLVSHKEASFETSLDSCSGLHSFFNVTRNAATYRWDFGDGAVSFLKEPLHRYSSDGEFIVTLTVNGETDCADTAVRILRNESPLGEIIYIPNTFTPNGDGVNDVFKVLSFRPCAEYALYIYNRWGQQIYSTDNALNTNWDGTFDGSNCQSDIYVYLLVGNGEEKKGFVNLLR